MGATDRFTRTEFQRLLDVTDKQLNYWERLHLVSPRKGGAEKFYDFRDLITLRTAKQLIEKGVSANRLRRSLVALNEKLSQVQAPLTELRIMANGRDVIVEHEGARLEPISGQFVLNFDTRELRDKVRVMPERSADDWFALALQYEADPASRADAIDAYGRVLSANPAHVDALINLGMLSYDGGELEKAADCFRRAVALEEGNAVARFNLGSVLDEMGELEEARQHLRLAVRLEPR
jgi:tetratricopeptide (TPR) repeat protein